MKENWLKTDYLIILLAGVIITIPLNFHGLFTSHDFNIHFKWSYLFAEQLISGELYPRWLAKDFSGYGSPVFFYYGPVPFYFSSFFYFLFHKISTLWIPITLAASFSIISSGLSSYLWFKSFSTSRASLIGAIVYMLMPYHLGIDLYTRFAYAECWSFVWMPLILLFTDKITKGKSLTGVIGITASLGLLLMTHLPSALIFLPFPLLYLLYFSKKRRIWVLILAYIMAFLISAIYWAPAVTYQKYANFSALLEYAWQDNLLFYNPENIEGSVRLWYYLNFSTLLILIVALIFLFQIKKYAKSYKKGYIFYGAMIIISFLMVTPLSIPVWLIFKPLQIIGFPWRFLSVFSLFFTAILAFYLSLREKDITFNNSQKRPIINFTYFVGVLILATNLMFVYDKIFESKALVENIDIHFLRDELIKEFKPAEHVPANISIENLRSIPNSKLLDVVEGYCEITILDIQPRLIKFDVNSNSYLSKIRINQFSFPGWKLAGDNKLNAKIKTENGLLYLIVPEGRHSIKLVLGRLTIEHYSIIISAITFIILLFMLVYKTAYRLPFNKKRNNNR